MSRDVERGDILNVMSGTTLYGKEICVPKEEVDRARELMKEYDSAGIQDDPKDKPKVRVPYLVLTIAFVVAVIFAIVHG